jgi:hypothetical protein
LRWLYSLLGAWISRLRDGPACLRFRTFPFFLGGPLSVQVIADALADRRGVTVTLRCLEERLVSVRSTRGGRKDSVEVCQMHSERRHMEDRMERGLGFPVEFYPPQ